MEVRCFVCEGIHMGWRSDVLYVNGYTLVRYQMFLYVKGYTWVGGQMFCMSMDTHWLDIRCFCM